VFMNPQKISARLVLPAFIASLLSISLSANAAETFTNERQMGAKYSALAQIKKENINNLQRAWEFHTGELDKDNKSLDAFQDEPSLIEGNLVVCTNSRRLIAIDPATGAQRWVYDPKQKTNGMRKCRGISAWTDNEAPADTACKTRIFLGTADYRLVAIDAKNGQPCSGFGTQGEIKMPVDIPQIFPGEVSAGSRVAIINGVVVVGSTIADDQRVDAPSGRVLAYDARTGTEKWRFDPLPRDASNPAAKTWLNGHAGNQGGGNVWSEMAVDESLDLVYLPTTSPSVDFYGGGRPGNNLYADSIVALKGSTGEVAWHFQFTHHNIWDYDTPAQPQLIDFPHNGQMVPALVQNLKTGLVFVFDRKTGEPLIPIEERPVPQQGAAPGEWLSPTQPFPVGIAPLAPQSVTPEDAWGFTPLDRWMCERKIAGLDHGPIYTPPSLKGMVLMPGAAGGANWGGGAYDPVSHTMVVPISTVAMIITLVPRETVKLDSEQAIETRGAMTFPTAGTPYVTKLEPLLSSFGAPCTAPPWAKLVAVDMTTGKVRWEKPLGSIDKLSPVPMPSFIDTELGTPGAGGPLITASGLVFIGYTLDNTFRAFDLNTGETIWKGDLPVPGMATPVTYEVNGEQYVVIAAGGHSMYGTPKGDSVVAYKLKQ